MKYRLLVWVILLFFGIGGNPLFAETPKNEKRRKPQFLSFDLKEGFVFPTNDFVSGDNLIPSYNSLSLKYGLMSSGNDWKDFAYGMPYYGIGFYMANFHRKHDLGLPLSLYLFQGATIKQFSPGFALKYEWNLGMSFNWKSYDPFDNPSNVVLGSDINIHVAGNLYASWLVGKRWGINTGIALTHFSNGAYRLPNSGLNLLAPYIELVYYFNNEKIRTQPTPDMIPPKFEKRLDYDISVTISSRQIRMDTLGTGLPSRYIDRRFKVIGVNYATLFANNYKYKWGPSLDLVYDESSGAYAWREEHPVDHKTYDRVALGRVRDRFSIGLSLKGEVVMPHVSIFAQIGYNLLHGNKYDFRLYQIMGVKAYLKDNLFGTFGIRASNFSKAQYLYWSIGYTIEGKPFSRKRDKYLQRVLP